MPHALSASQRVLCAAVAMAAAAAAAGVVQPAGAVRTFVPPSDVQVIGRHRTEPGGGIAFDHPGVSIRLSVTGTSDIIVNLTQVFPPSGSQAGMHPSCFDVMVDGMRVTVPKAGAPDPRLCTDDATVGNPVYAPFMASGLDPFVAHDLVLYKSTEAMWNSLYPAPNYVVLNGLSLGGPTNPQLSGAPELPTRRIEFVGDSITAGYCNLCAPFQDMHAESNIDSWTNQICDTLSAQCHTAAWSGYGLTRNCCGGTTLMTSIYRRTLASVPEEDWGFSASGWTPHALVVNLGTNDHINSPASNTTFASAYVELLKNVTRDYKPAPHIFLACGPMSTAYCPDVDLTLSAAKAMGLSATFLDQRGLVEPSCCGHPSVKADTNMAARGAATIKTAMGW